MTDDRLFADDGTDLIRLRWLVEARAERAVDEWMWYWLFRNGWFACWPEYLLRPAALTVLRGLRP